MNDIMRYVLVFFAIKYEGDFFKILDALTMHEYVQPKDIEFVQDKIKNDWIKVITAVDEDYPEELKFINNPPFVLFFKNENEWTTNPFGSKNSLNIH